MFENLTDRLQDIFGKMGRKGKLTEQDVDEVMREVKLAMLEADVNFKVVKDFIKRLKERAIGAEVLQSLSPAQQVVKIVNDEMMDEVAAIRMRVDPTEVLLIADAMTGQDAVRVAEEFNARVPLSGLILTKVDGDARGGAALSIRSVTGIPLKFLSVGEKPDQLEPFYPDRLASRILGMGDMLSLIERAEATFDQKQGEALERKLRAGGFDLEDFLQQLQQIKKMGPLSQILEMIPGMRNLTRNADMPQVDDSQIKRIEAIINSMTIAERRNPAILDASRRRRIAKGSGTTVQEINALLNQFKQMQKMMKQLSAGRMPKMFAGLGR